MGLASLRSSFLTSILGGFFLAHSRHVVTPGSASRRAAGIGLPQRLHRIFARFFGRSLIIHHQLPDTIAAPMAAREIPEILTPRLRLRPWRDQDLAPFAAMNA